MKWLRRWLAWKMIPYLYWLEERPNHSMRWYRFVFHLAHAIYPSTAADWKRQGSVGLNALETILFWESIEALTALSPADRFVDECTEWFWHPTPARCGDSVMFPLVYRVEIQRRGEVVDVHFWFTVSDTVPPSINPTFVTLKENSLSTGEDLDWAKENRVFGYTFSNQSPLDWSIGKLHQFMIANC